MGRHADFHRRLSSTTLRAPRPVASRSPAEHVPEAGARNVHGPARPNKNDSVMHIHILGICGTFMGGLAALAREAGHKVTGCDANVYPPMSDQLRALGIELIDGYGTDQVALAPDLFVIGNAVSRGNPLMEAILDDGLPYVSGPQWLAEHVLEGRHVLAVAGTHGKTTTTAMLAWILDQAGLEPGFLVGGVPRNFGVSARLGKTARRRRRAHAVRHRGRRVRHRVLRQAQQVRPLPPAHGGAEQPRVRPRGHLPRPGRHRDASSTTSCARCRRAGRLVVNAREESLQRVLERGCWSEVQRFGARKEEPGALRARGEPHAFDVLRGSMKIARVEWPLLGEHNQMNALAAIAAAEHVGVAPAAAAAALATFENVARRLELQGRGQRRPRLRRLRAPPDRDPHHHRRPAPQGRRAAHPGRVRAALQHDEAGRDEGAAAVGARGGRPVVLPLRRPRRGTPREALAPMGEQAQVCDTIGALVVGRRARGQAGRPHPVHEQRRLRRHPREAAGRARGAAHLTSAAC